MCGFLVKKETSLSGENIADMESISKHLVGDINLSQK